jgi:hypothetical protein
VADDLTHYPIDRIWRGAAWGETGILVLGEYWTGHYEGPLRYDDGWIRAYLAGTVKDRLYTSIANALRMSPADFWDRVAFTNFAQCAGPNAGDRPTASTYQAGVPRLKAVLDRYQPKAVWVLGKRNGHHCGAIIAEAGIPFEVCPQRVAHVVTSKSWAVVQRLAGCG